MTLATIDWVIVGVLGISTLLSIRRGFVKEALSLVTWIAAVLIARLFAGQFTVVLEPYIETDSLRSGASYLILFIATLMVGGMVNYLVSEFVKITGLSGLDRLLGTVFGFARGGVIVLMFVALMHYVLPVEEDDWYRQSQLIPQLVIVIEEFGPVFWEQGEEFLDNNPGNSLEPGLINSPEPGLINSPEPVLINSPEPGLINSPEPVLINSPEPGLINSPEPGLINSPEPVLINSPESGLINSPGPVLINSPEPVLKQQS